MGKGDSKSTNQNRTESTSFTVGENDGVMLGDGAQYSNDDNSVWTDNSDRSFTDNSDRSYNDNSSWTDNSDRSFTDNSDRSFTDNSDNSFTDNSTYSVQETFTDSSDRSFTDNSDNSFTDTSDRSFTDNSDNSFTDTSDRSFTDNSSVDNSVYDYSDRSFTDNSDNSITEIDAGVVDMAGRVVDSALLTVSDSIAKQAQVSEYAMGVVNSTAERSIQSAELMTMENTKFLDGVSDEMNETFRDISATNAMLYSKLGDTYMENLRTVERATDGALSVAANVSRSDDAMQTESVVKWGGLAVTVIGVAVALRG